MVTISPTTAVAVAICAGCGNHVEVADTSGLRITVGDARAVPLSCPICSDDRQYVGTGGQRWTSLAALADSGHRLRIAEVEPGLDALTVQPTFAIGHRGLLISTPAGGVLFDPPGFLDDEAIGAVRRAGGLVAIARSHPHLCGAQVAWSHAFGGAPIWIPEADRRWITSPDPAIRFWQDSAELAPGVRIIRCGGHFAGSAVLHWTGTGDGRGALLVGDTLQVCPGERRVSFMRSYPMMLPLPERYLDRLLAALSPLEYDRIHGGFEQSIRSGAQAVVAEGAALYRSWLTGTAFDPDQDS